MLENTFRQNYKMKTIHHLGWQVMFAFSVLTAPCAPNLDATESYFINFNKGDNNWDILVPARVGGNVYVNSMTAILIESVVCDGVTINPELRLRAGGANRKTAVIGQTTVIYRFEHSFLYCWKDIVKNEPQTSEVLIFPIPENVHNVRILFRIRTPDRKLSDMNEAVLVESDRETGYLDDRSKPKP